MLTFPGLVLLWLCCFVLKRCVVNVLFVLFPVEVFLFVCYWSVCFGFVRSVPFLAGFCLFCFILKCFLFVCDCSVCVVLL